MSDTDRAGEAATKLAKALDAEDYAAAQLLLDNGCIYHGGPDGEIIGADAILDSYRAHGANENQSRFDEIIFSSEVQPAGPGWATIRYLDRLRLRGHWHDHYCLQHIRIGASGSIIEIRHENLPGEVEALREFEAKHKQA